ncbi:Alpha-ribazole-5'-phosphate phosphatase [Streptococcus sp. DD11]|uniref:histidine phosphatase family protein n=1 Tax=Streptococcus sp. DD11 TaxID=1777879 RepID=UPI00079225A1|nr:histidine phosphatase family protein [Streptococcus sp. DD11]KXT85908.1 Alpha-ribazole-5'-phosphate phosphatase [Streptococcus sp. DD11]
MKRWYLMRHGQTDYNRRRCFYGSQDVSINEQGQAEAKQLRLLMQERAVEAVYTSRLKRTQETARLAFPSRHLQPIADFDERDFGQWEGLTADEIEAAFPEIWQAWLEAPFEVTPPEAEVFSDFQTRVWAATDRLLDNAEESIALVAHLGVLRLIYQHLVDREAVFWNIDVPQGRVLLLEEQDQTWQATLL